MRGLQEFQLRHPDAVVVAFTIVEDKEGVVKVTQRHQLDTLRIAPGKEWQSKFGLSEQIPVTLVLAEGHVRVMHDAVLPDPVAYLEADLAAIGGTSAK